jgi:hypothetical protein
MDPGQTILMTEGATKRHLWIVVARDPATRMVLMVNVTTHRGTALEDESCILSAGDHPYIKHDSWVNYQRARLVPEGPIDERVASGNRVKTDEDVSSEVLKRILEGATATDKLTIGDKKFLADLGLIEVT